ncbi:MAG: hypothetical protein EA401_14430, partial [Planctomycetota bacterium]
MGPIITTCSERETVQALLAQLMADIKTARLAIEAQDNLTALTSLSKAERLALQVNNRLQDDENPI